MPLGAAVGGILAELLGLQAVFAIMGGLTLTLLIGMFWVTDKRMTQAELDAEVALGADAPH
jgi:predicted MFS family arabinose efflux permease